MSPHLYLGSETMIRGVTAIHSLGVCHWQVEVGAGADADSAEEVPADQMACRLDRLASLPLLRPSRSCRSPLLPLPPLAVGSPRPYCYQEREVERMALGGG